MLIRLTPNASMASMSPMTNNMNTVRVTSAEFRALKDSGQMTDIGDNQGQWGGNSPNYPIWDGRTLEWVMVVVTDAKAA